MGQRPLERRQRVATLEQIERCLRGLGSIGVPTFAHPAIKLPNGGCLDRDSQFLGRHTTNHTTASTIVLCRAVVLALNTVTECILDILPALKGEDSLVDRHATASRGGWRQVRNCLLAFRPIPGCPPV